MPLFACLDWLGIASHRIEISARCVECSRDISRMQPTQKKQYNKRAKKIKPRKQGAPPIPFSKSEPSQLRETENGGWLNSPSLWRSARQVSLEWRRKGYSTGRLSKEFITKHKTREYSSRRRVTEWLVVGASGGRSLLGGHWAACVSLGKVPLRLPHG